MPNHIVNIAKKIDDKHEQITARIEGVSMTAGILTGIASAGAALAAPSGLADIGVALGITCAPLIVTAAPVLATIATVSASHLRWRFLLCKMEKSPKEERHISRRKPRIASLPIRKPNCQFPRFP